jgi:hypothetical protein
MGMTKKCTQCEQTKNIGEFKRDPRNTTGLAAECRQCTIDRSRDYNQRKAEREGSPFTPRPSPNREDVAGRKQCSMCGDEKPLTKFHKDSNRPDGRRSMCAECRQQGIAEERHGTVRPGARIDQRVVAQATREESRVAHTAALRVLMSLHEEQFLALVADEIREMRSGRPRWVQA